MESEKLLNKHNISYDYIRSLTIDCYALDIAAYALFIDGIHADGSDRTKEIYREKLSTSLLNLSVAVRTLFYQGVETIVKPQNISYCGFYESDNKEDEASVSIKDVCDKIIHADSLDRVFEKTGDDGRKPITSISGTYKRKPWVLEISVDLFCASVLNWVDELEQA